MTATVVHTPATHRTGLILLMAGALIDSSSGLFSRLLHVDGFTLTAGRGMFAFIVILSLLVARDGRNTFASLRSVGAVGLLIVGMNALGMLFNMLSLTYTGVANFFMIFATAPFVAAIAARMVLGEKLDGATLAAAAAGFTGIAVMMVSGAKSGGLLGDVLAMACVITYSCLILLVRRTPKLDILPVACLTVLCSGLIGLPWADFSPLTATTWPLMAVFGLVQLGIGNLLIFNAMQRIPAAQSGLLGILNAAFAPIWVLAFLGEVPEAATLLGGTIILASAALHLWWTMRKVSFSP